MAISKKTRFEVFKRDRFTCQYCGRTPPTVILEADHVHPVAEGGLDDIDNLVTSCFDCNRGKRDILLTEVPETLAEKMKAVTERREQLAAYTEMVEAVRRDRQERIDRIADRFATLFPGREMSAQFKSVSLVRFLEHFTEFDLCDFLEMAAERRPKNPDAALKYFCGICWTKIRNQEKGRK